MQLGVENRDESPPDVLTAEVAAAVVVTATVVTSVAVAVAVSVAGEAAPNGGRVKTLTFVPSVTV